MHPPVFVRQVRLSWVRLSAKTARSWRAHGNRVCVVDGADDHSPLRPRRGPLCKRHYTTRWNALICRVLVGSRDAAWPVQLSAWSAQLSQIPVNGIIWLQVGQSPPVRPSLKLWRVSLGDSPRLSIQALRVCICSSVASSGVPSRVPSPHSKWPQPGSCRSLGFAPVNVPLRWTGYTTYRMSECSTMSATGTLYDPSARSFETNDALERRASAAMRMPAPRLRRTEPADLYKIIPCGLS